MVGVIAASVPPPLDPGAVLVRWSLPPFAILGCAAAVVWYVVAARRARRLGSPVSGARLAAFVGGAGVVLLALASGIDTYADVSLTIHVVQHLLLTLVAPPLLALGGPVALSMRAAARPAAERASRWLRSRVARAASHPIVGFTVFAGLPFALHLSPVYDLAVREPAVHVLEHVVLLAAGVVYWWPIVGVDPMPHRPAHGARVVSLLLLLPAQAFLALALFSASEPLYATYRASPPPFGGSAALGDQRTAAAVMWVVGSMLVISSALAVAVRWRSDEQARQARFEALTSRRRGASRSA